MIESGIFAYAHFGVGAGDIASGAAPADLIVCQPNEELRVDLRITSDNATATPKLSVWAVPAAVSDVAFAANQALGFLWTMPISLNQPDNDDDIRLAPGDRIKISSDIDGPSIVAFVVRKK